jgi:hypothetical protein
MEDNILFFQATPQIQYADLQFSPNPARRVKFKKDETPYVEISGVLTPKYK